MAAPVQFYFDFASPYGYLASTQIDTLAERHGRSVDWHPMLLGAVFKVTGGQPLTGIPIKGDYTGHDLLRFARFLDVPFRMPDPMPMHSVAAARAYYWREQEEGPGPAKVLAKAIFHAHFGEGRDLSRPEAIAELADAAGLDSKAMLDGMQSQNVKDRLRAVTDEGIGKGVFGSPFVIVDGEGFWGADRLDQVERWLATGGW